MSNDAGLHHFTAKVIGKKVFSLTVQGDGRHVSDVAGWPRTTTMLEVMIAVLTLSSAGIFAAHAIDAWRA